MAAPQTQVSISRNLRKFDVHTDVPALRQYHNALFSGDSSSPMCKFMAEATGHAQDKCGAAAAFTYWDVRVEPDAGVYDTLTGRKKPDVAVTCNVTMALPTWSHLHAAPKPEQDEVRRFEMQTAYHERGHAMAGENCARTVAWFVDSLPSKVDVERARDYNAAITAFVREFYVRRAHAADVEYDHSTDHGRVQGAEAVDSVGLGGLSFASDRPISPHKPV